MARNLLPLGGLLLECPPARAGQSTLLVRPEDIQIGPVHADAGQAVVQHRSFLGDRIQLTLSLADQDPLKAEVLRDHPAKVGDRVGICIAPERLMSSEENI